MSDFGPSPRSSAADAGAGSAFRSAMQFVSRHPVGMAQVFGALLLAIIVLQNVEPVAIDILFWSIASVPKLVLILISMGIGGVAWELIRRWLFR